MPCWRTCSMLPAPRPARPLPEKAADPLTSAIALLHAQTKFDFSGYKTATLRRRIQRRMSLRHLDQMPAYVELLRNDPAEVTALFKDLLINVTSFFREPAAWEFLQEQVIRRLVAEKDPDAPLRVWVPACASGEEAYSIAMVRDRRDRGGREELSPAGVRLGRRCRGTGDGARRCLPGGDRRPRVTRAVVPILHQGRSQLSGEQGAARHGRLCATEPGRRPALLQARPDQLSQSPHLSRAGGAGADHRACCTSRWSKGATCSWAAPRASGRGRICSRRCPRSGGSTAASGRRATTRLQFPVAATAAGTRRARTDTESADPGPAGSAGATAAAATLRAGVRAHQPQR